MRGIGFAKHVTRGAEKDAEAHFGLASPAEVLTFIADSGLENVQLIDDRTPWLNCPTKPAPMVHSYRFQSGERRGYIAFFSYKDKWHIKSFKTDDNPPPTLRKSK